MTVDRTIRHVSQSSVNTFIHKRLGVASVAIVQHFQRPLLDLSLAPASRVASVPPTANRVTIDPSTAQLTRRRRS
jgi:hypothetical protein